MIGGATMAKKTRGKPNPDQMVTRAVRMRQEYAAWFERFAQNQRVSLASLMDRALSAHAEQTGFESPPQRVP
jgi:hypothetical protein